MTNVDGINLDGMSEIDKLITIIENYFPHKSEAVKALLGTVASLAVNGSRKTVPMWLYGEAGVAKSSILEIVGGGLNETDWCNIGQHFALFVENFSAKSFRSVKIRDDSLDLLDILGDSGPRVLITSELNLIWTKPRQQLDELCGQITKICDDNPSISYASAGRISGSRETSASQNFVWLAATISLPDKVAKRFSISLGPRLYFYHIREPTQTAAEIAAKLTEMETQDRDYWEKLIICQRAVAAFVEAVNIIPCTISWDRRRDQGTEILSNLATILRVLRAGLTESHKAGQISFRSTFEAAQRCRKICTALARGQAVLREANSIGLEDIPLVVRIILDTAEACYPARALIFIKLLENYGNITVMELSNSLRYTREFTIEEVRRLEFLGLVKFTDSEISLTEEYFAIALSLRPYVHTPEITRGTFTQGV